MKYENLLFFQQNLIHVIRKPSSAFGRYYVQKIEKISRRKISLTGPVIQPTISGLSILRDVETENTTRSKMFIELSQTAFFFFQVSCCFMTKFVPKLSVQGGNGGGGICPFVFLLHYTSRTLELSSTMYIVIWVNTSQSVTYSRAKNRIR